MSGHNHGSSDLSMATASLAVRQFNPVAQSLFSIVAQAIRPYTSRDRSQSGKRAGPRKTRGATPRVSKQPMQSRVNVLLAP